LTPGSQSTHNVNVFALLRRLYHWTLELAAHRRAVWALAGVSFAESSFFPIPPDVVLIPMCVTNRRRALWYATVCTAASVLGGLAGYAIGAFLWETVGQAIINFYRLADEMNAFKESYRLHGAWIIAIAGFTPVPYKLFTIASGVFQYPVLEFAIISTLARGARFYLVAGLLMWFGEPIKAFIEKRFELVTVVFTVLLVGGFFVLRYFI
jgi:membrane protein YqaA with SNARE-associated domain